MFSDDRNVGPEIIHKNSHVTDSVLSYTAYVV